MEQVIEQVAPEQLSELRELTRGKKLLIVGGDSSPEKQTRLQQLLELNEINWPRTRKGVSPDRLLPAVRNSDLVIFLARWLSHDYTEVRSFAQLHRKPLIWMDRGMGNERIIDEMYTQLTGKKERIAVTPTTSSSEVEARCRKLHSLITAKAGASSAIVRAFAELGWEPGCGFDLTTEQRKSIASRAGTETNYVRSIESRLRDAVKKASNGSSTCPREEDGMKPSASISAVVEQNYQGEIETLTELLKDADAENRVLNQQLRETQAQLAVALHGEAPVMSVKKLVLSLVQDGQAVGDPMVWHTLPATTQLEVLHKAGQVILALEADSDV